MQPFPDSRRSSEAEVSERLDALAAWIQEIDSRVSATEVATGDEKTAKELRKAVEAIAKHDPKLADRLTNQVDVLADRVATLAGTVSTTTAALAGKDGEVAALRRELAEADARIAELRAEVRSAPPPGELDDLRRAVARISTERAGRSGDRRVEGVEEKVALLAQRLDTLSTTVSTTAATLAGRDGEVTALRRRMDDEGARLGAAIAEVRQALDPTSIFELRKTVEAVSEDASTFRQEYKSSLVRVGVDLETVTQRIASLDTSVAMAVDAAAKGDAEIGRMRARLEESVGRIGALDARVDDVGSRLGRFAEQVAELGVTAEQLSDRIGTATELAALAGRFETGCAQIDALVGDLRGALDTMPSTGPGPELVGAVESLSEQLATLRAEVDRVARTDETERLSAAVRSLERRLESSKAEVDALATEVVRATMADETGRLRSVVEELWTRLEATEGELHTSQDVEARVDDLTGRLHAIEKKDMELGPAAGEGRLRVEIRALELRLEHAEEAARESREAVLTQLELLAAKIESRLQELESQPLSLSYADPVTDGHVIPIRSSEA